MGIVGTPFGVLENVRTFMTEIGVSRLPLLCPAGVPANVIHTPENLMVHTKVTLVADLPITLGATGARAGGVKLLDMPACRAAVQASRIKLVSARLSDPAATSTAGEIGLGTVVGSGAVAVLGGTATFEDILEGGLPALGNIAAAGSITNYATGDSSRTRVGNLSAAWAVFVNAATTLGSAPLNTQIILGSGSEFEFWWHCIRP